MPLLRSENILPSKAKAGLSQPHGGPQGRWALCCPCADGPEIADQPARVSHEQEWRGLGRYSRWESSSAGRRGRREGKTGQKPRSAAAEGLQWDPGISCIVTE